jgi:hypothetical protein
MVKLDCVRPAHAWWMLALGALLLAARPAAALDLRPEAVGVEVDLLPVVASAAAGEAGGALQVWAGRDRLRLRLVGADLHYPDAFTPSPFGDRHTTAAAVLLDLFFRDGFRGPWVAAGAEYWWSEIGLRHGEGRGRWSSPVATVGAGWVLPIWRGLYLNPWAAAHTPLGSRSVAVGGERYHPHPVEAEVSLKLGWAFPVSR